MRRKETRGDRLFNKFETMRKSEKVKIANRWFDAMDTYCSIYKNIFNNKKYLSSKK